jgi:cytochrome c-type biogenesis protein CcmE
MAMNPRRKARLLMILASLCGLGLATGLVLYALEQNIDLFYVPSELIDGKGPNKEKPRIGQTLRLGGLVVPGTVIRDPQSLRVSFQVVDRGPLATVTYDGILPDLFREGQGIVARGVLVAPDRLEASEVLAKHDEEYMPPDLIKALEENHGEGSAARPSTPKTAVGGY